MSSDDISDAERAVIVELGVKFGISSLPSIFTRKAMAIVEDMLEIAVEHDSSNEAMSIIVQNTMKRANEIAELGKDEENKFQTALACIVIISSLFKSIEEMTKYKHDL